MTSENYNTELYKCLKEEDKRMVAIIKSRYDVMNSIDLETGICHRTYLRSISQDSEHVIIGDYDDAIKLAHDQYICDEYKQVFMDTLSLASLRRQAAELDGESSELIIEYRMKNNPVEWVESHVFCIRQNDDVKVHVLGRDVTQKKHEKEQEMHALKEALALAEQANDAKTEFLSRMSHDIRTPMNAIIGMTAIAGINLQDPERLSDCLNKINVASKHLLSLINDVLDMSKIESGTVNLNEEEFSLSDLFNNVLSMVQPSIDGKDQDLEVHINNVVHESVIGDPLRLQRVFVNILSNATKYTPAGGKIRVDITEKPSRVADYSCYEFVFADNGIGMSEEFLKHIFEPFTRAESSTLQSFEGTGLGMAIAQNIVRMMNGNIEVESKLGEGSKFHVSLFLKHNEPAAIDANRFLELPVLVVDDDKDNCEATCIILSEIGMNSEWVLNGREAITRVTDRHAMDDDYFAIILDWKMPEMNGIETARQIRQIVGPEVTIIILSAFDWSLIEAEARMAGVDGFISKPLFKSRLVYLFDQLTSKERQEIDNPWQLTSSSFAGKRILLAEDNALNLEIIIEFVKQTGADIFCVTDGKQAVEAFEKMPENHYDLIFMDIQMPVMNGYDATRAIRQLDRKDAHKIPIIAMTANAFHQDAVLSRRAGMNEHLTKPLSFEQVVECMHRWIH